ncbi:uncharacterized protein LOC112685933 [Sipha flava]|uniref:Uncharacterized protein LOC112685933 n=2 Tax=Sipha flava TaxID=143950 RepID=A0A8B8FTG6_9HEMI|nr:uncharacterized protein LOC112685933 [Sipha flava]
MPMYAILLLSLYFFFFFSTNVVCTSLTNYVSSKNNTPFWINPCGYDTYNNEDDSDASIIYRILNLAKQSQNNINSFKTCFIMRTFNIDYFNHYERWANENNSWMIPRLLKSAEDDLPRSFLNSRSFPEELLFTYEILQRVSVGLEKLLEDAEKIDFPEHQFLKNFVTCKNNLQQILCEVNDAIEIKSQIQPDDITRDAIPNEVRQESSTAKRHLVNSLIFRDYMIAIKYLINTYESFG